MEYLLPPCIMFTVSAGRGLDGYRPWFYAAAVYNLAWGGSTIVFPETWFELLGAASNGSLVFWQLVGMFVLVFAPGYWWAARAPERHAHLILVGLLGNGFRARGHVWPARLGAGARDRAQRPHLDPGIRSVRAPGGRPTRLAGLPERSLSLATSRASASYPHRHHCR
jgi:hypothetical protein